MIGMRLLVQQLIFIPMFQKQIDVQKTMKKFKTDDPTTILNLDLSKSHLVSLVSINVFQNIVTLNADFNKITDISLLVKLPKLRILSL